jgi:formamidopyrimidine-DNA glycosylase
MPELPEVETVCWRLREGGQGEKRLVGNRIDAVFAVDAKVVRSGSLDDVRGHVVTGVARRAKWIHIQTDGPRSLLCHLKMTGDLHVLPKVPEKFVRWRLSLDNGQHLVFTDPRRFGHVDVVDDAAPFFADLGPEPLDAGFSVDVLQSRLRGARPIKAALLDQGAIAGLGNIYADEALHRAGIDPRRRADRLDRTEIERLHGGIQDVLNESIQETRGELAWRYENRDTPSPFRVYERAGELCLTCATVLKSTNIAGRTTVWCPTCQPAQAAAKTKKAKKKSTKKKTVKTTKPK